MPGMQTASLGTLPQSDWRSDQRRSSHIQTDRQTDSHVTHMRIRTQRPARAIPRSTDLQTHHREGWLVALTRPLHTTLTARAGARRGPLSSSLPVGVQAVVES